MHTPHVSSIHSSTEEDVSCNEDVTQHEKEIVTTRAYQLEMFEKSMQSNIIVAMDTGSGKTWIAKLRIEAELRRRPSKIVWFTAPSVVLAEQQHKYLSHHLTSFSTRLITGADNTHLWSTQEVWDAILNVNLVVSTPQVLLEGLERGFLQLRRISLLVVDEAHHCIAKNPSNIIMQSFYHQLRRTNSTIEVPCILGMTASPITKKLANMSTLESNLDAVCKSPTQQIEEYRKYVYLPQVVTLDYTVRESRQSLPIELTLRILESVNISEDPWVKQFLRVNQPETLHKRDKVIMSRKTFSMEQLKKLVGNTEHVYSQLGAWATNIWLREVLLKLHSTVESRCWLTNISDEEHMYLDAVLKEIRELTCRAVEEGSVIDQLSSKAECLIRFLNNEYAENPKISCVIFVERRSTAFALTKLLQNHPAIQCTVASFVGGSNSGKKANLIDLADLATQMTELEEFRSGLRTIVVTTSVMEEGIDVQATNLVIRWDDALTVRSWIQSRGRARKVASKFVVMHCIEEISLNTKRYTDWMKLEVEMRMAYMDEMRQMTGRLALEEEDKEEGQAYTIGSSGARLTFENARNLLEHCCRSISRVQFLSPRPKFICSGTHGSEMSAKVILPSSLPAELREVRGRRIWRTEKAAKRDAAFEAVKRLHECGLLNDHLLPPAMPKLNTFSVETRATFADIRPQMNPWLPIASHPDGSASLHVYRMDLENVLHPTAQPQPPLLLLLPTRLEFSVRVPLYYTKAQTFYARISYVEIRTMSSASRALSQEVTTYLVRTTLVSQRKDPESWKHGFPFYLLPNIPEVDLGSWFDHCKESSSLAKVLARPLSSSKPQVTLKYAARHGVYLTNLERRDLVHKKSLFALPEAIPAILARRVPRRIDYLAEANVPASMTCQQITLAIDECTLEQISPSIVENMQFVPSILHIIEFALVSTMCCKDLLQKFNIKNQMLLAEALTSPLAYGYANYERLEFFGDTLLKLYACLQVFAEPRNAILPEGYLTLEAAKLINNARLQRAAIELGLDLFMVHEPFIPKSWKPETNISQPTRSSRHTSTKVIADHVEAIIAVVYLDDSCSDRKDGKAIAFLNVLLPEIQWSLPSINAAAVSAMSPGNRPSFEALSVVDSILDYSVQQRHLLAEALNHSSTSTDVPTYGRLEFLGDAVLQRIVNEAVYDAPVRYSQNAMHLRQIACVSHSYLAFLCFEAHHEVERVNVSSDLRQQTATLVRTSETKYLWQYMIHSDADIAPAQQRSFKRYLECRDQIKEELEQGKTYPWALLASIAAPKFFSDIIESVLAAVYIDSGADLEICSKVLEKLGLMKLLRRLLVEPDMILEQPKTILWQERAKAGLPGLKVVFQNRGNLNEKRYNCQLLLASEVYAEVNHAWCEDEAVLRACEVGLEKFRREQEASKMPGGPVEANQLSLDTESGHQKRKRENPSQSTLGSMVSDEE